MAAQIEEPKAGDPVNELWRVVAELVRAVNALNNLQVSPSDLGSFKYADNNVMLILNTTDCASSSN